MTAEAVTDPAPAVPVREPTAPADGDAELVAALRRGDEHAFRTLVHRHGGYLYAVALRVLASEADARDAVQDALVNVARYVGEFEGRSALRTWLHRLVVNAALMRRRAERRRQDERSIDELAPAIDGVREEPAWQFVESVEASAARAEVRAAVRAAIGRLPDDYRIVLVLRDVEGLDTREVAELVGEREGNVKVRLHRARAALKRLLEPVFRGQTR